MGVFLILHLKGNCNCVILCWQQKSEAAAGVYKDRVILRAARLINSMASHINLLSFRHSSLRGICIGAQHCGSRYECAHSDAWVALVEANARYADWSIITAVTSFI